MSQCKGGQELLNLYLLPLSALTGQWSLLSGTLVGIARHTNSEATQAMKVEENRGWVNLKVHDHN